MRVNDIPKIPLLLAVGGIMPFVALVISPSKTFLNYQPMIMFYAAIILSFLGGINWGFAMQAEDNMLFYWSVIPALWAWFLLGLQYYFTPNLIRTWLGLLAGFLIQWLIDLALVRRQIAPIWFANLRSLISVLVVTLNIVIIFRIIF